MEAIYNGEFYPSEVVPKSEKYREALKACEKIMDQLAERLTKEDYDLVEKLMDQSSIAPMEQVKKLDDKWNSGRPWCCFQPKRETAPRVGGGL